MRVRAKCWRVPPMIPSLRRANVVSSLLVAATVWLATGCASASGWRSALYPEDWQPPGPETSFYTEAFLQDFSYAGYRRGEVAIPDILGPVHNVVIDYGADPTGATDSTAAIQAAIDAAGAAGGGVVFLPAGGYRVAPPEDRSAALLINRPNVVLRGAGVGQTFILNTSYQMRRREVIRLSPGAVVQGPPVAITAHLTGPTRRIPVADAAAFAPGDLVRIEWSFTTEWIAEHGQQEFWNEERHPSPARYLREVTRVDPGEGWIEVDVPTRYSINPRDGANVRKIDGMLSQVGVEFLSLGNVQHPGTSWVEQDYATPGTAPYDVHGAYLLRLFDVYDAWVRSVHSFQYSGNTSTAHLLSSGILLSRCFRVTVSDCRFERAQFGGAGGNGYLYHVSNSYECLLADNVAAFSRHGFVVSFAGTSGNVFLRCEDRDTARATGDTGEYTTRGSGSDNHMHFSHSNLWDQCHAHDSFWTASHRQRSGTVPHGLSSAKSVYWNTTGSGTRGGPLVRSEQARYGYVIGTSGERHDAVNPTRGNTNTEPADILEGIGRGDTLQPRSLYLDQLARRLRGPVVGQ